MDKAKHPAPQNYRLVSNEDIKRKHHCDRDSTITRPSNYLRTYRQLLFDRGFGCWGRGCWLGFRRGFDDQLGHADFRTVESRLFGGHPLLLGVDPGEIDCFRGRSVSHRKTDCEKACKRKRLGGMEVSCQ